MTDNRRHIKWGYLRFCLCHPFGKGALRWWWREQRSKMRDWWSADDSC